MIEERFDCLFPDVPTNTEAAIETGIVFGIIFSYLPQHVNIVSRGTSEGISPWFLFMGSVSSFCSVSNEFILGWREVSCCAEWGGAICFKNILKLMQLGVQWLSQGMVFILFVAYFTNKRERKLTWRLSLVLAASYIGIIIAHACVQIGLSVTHGPYSIALRDYAQFLGLVSLILVYFQYTPQLYETYKRKSPGSLSITMLAIQCPGTYVWCYFLATGDEHHISTWIPFFTTASLQLLLLSLCCYYVIRAPGKRLSEPSNDTGVLAEDFPHIRYGSINGARENVTYPTVPETRP
eukprot:Nk52_evm33s217 gene=Nk52_evmTU33s217